MAWFRKPPETRLREEFNLWAERGEGPAMECSHRDITERTLDAMRLKAGDHVLDLGCGSGWTCRRMAPLVAPSGLVVGVDIADAMIREAEAATLPHSNIRYKCAGAAAIPWTDGFFTHVISVESFYYYPDQRTVLHELLRVTRPGGRIFLLLCIYQENTLTQHWIAKLNVPVQVLSIAQYRGLLGDCGWSDVDAIEYMPDPAEPHPNPHSRALLLTARR